MHPCFPIIEIAAVCQRIGSVQRLIVQSRFRWVDRQRLHHDLSTIHHFLTMFLDSQSAKTFKKACSEPLEAANMFALKIPYNNTRGKL